MLSEIQIPTSLTDLVNECIVVEQEQGTEIDFVSYTFQTVLLLHRCCRSVLMRNNDRYSRHLIDQIK